MGVVVDPQRSCQRIWCLSGKHRRSPAVYLTKYLGGRWDGRPGPGYVVLHSARTTFLFPFFLHGFISHLLPSFPSLLWRLTLTALPTPSSDLPPLTSALRDSAALTLPIRTRFYLPFSCFFVSFRTFTDGWKVLRLDLDSLRPLGQFRHGFPPGDGGAVQQTASVPDSRPDPAGQSPEDAAATKPPADQLPCAPVQRKPALSLRR